MASTVCAFSRISRAWRAEIGAHAHVVLLVGGGRDRVDARRVREHLVLADERGGGVLGDHEAVVQAAVADEEGRQAAAQGRVHEALGAALGDARAARRGRCRGSRAPGRAAGRGSCRRRGWRRRSAAPSGRHPRDDRGGGRRRRAGCRSPSSARSPGRRARRRRRRARRRAPAACSAGRRRPGRGRGTPSARPGSPPAACAGSPRSAAGRRAGARACRRSSKASGTASSASAVSAPTTSAVSSRRAASKTASAPSAAMACVPLQSDRPSLAASVTGSMPAARSASPPSISAAGEARAALAHQHQGDVGERGEVAGGAHRALARHHRQHAALEHRDERLRDHRPHTRAPGDERVGAEQQHRAHHLVGERRADAGAAARHQVALQQLDVLVGDAHVGEPAEAGVHAVDGFAAPQAVFDDGAARLHRRVALRRDRHRLAVARDAHHVVDRQAAPSRRTVTSRPRSGAARRPAHAPLCTRSARRALRRGSANMPALRRHAACRGGHASRSDVHLDGLAHREVVDLQVVAHDLLDGAERHRADELGARPRSRRSAAPRP